MVLTYGAKRELFLLCVESETIYEESFPDAETYEVKFYENYVSHDEWINLMHEKNLIDELLFGEKKILSPYTNQI